MTPDPTPESEKAWREHVAKFEFAEAEAVPDGVVYEGVLKPVPTPAAAGEEKPAFVRRTSCPCCWTTPCHSRCTCIMPGSSSGCARCCRYGNDKQKRERAKALAARIDQDEFAVPPLPQSGGGSGEQAKLCPWCGVGICDTCTTCEQCRKDFCQLDENYVDSLRAQLAAAEKKALAFESQEAAMRHELADILNMLGELVPDPDGDKPTEKENFELVKVVFGKALSLLTSEPRNRIVDRLCEAEKQLAAVTGERDKFRWALTQVRAHTSYMPYPPMSLLTGLLASCERIACAALAPRPATEGRET